MSRTVFAVNLGGAGEVPGVLNQQPPSVLSPFWRDRYIRTFADSITAGNTYLICPNDVLALPDGIADVVLTNNIPLDIVTSHGPGVQSSEAKRILKSGGEWYLDGVLHYTKP